MTIQVGLFSYRDSQAREWMKDLELAGYAVMPLPSESGFESLSKLSVNLLIAELHTPVPSASEDTFITNVKDQLGLLVVAIIDPKAVELWGLITKVDDFLVTPVRFPELVARLKRLHVKIAGVVTSAEQWQTGLNIDTEACQVIVDGNPINLTFKEYELLKYLAASPGKVFSREALLSSVWGYDYYGGERTVDVHITRLRSKIEIRGYTFIETVRSLGYRFKSEPRNGG